MRLPALSCLLDRLTIRLLDLGERGGELLPNRMLAAGDRRARHVMCVAGMLERDPVWAFAPFTDRIGAPGAIEPVVVPPKLGPVRADQNIETATIGNT